jgi:hypothetical protein
MRERRYGSNIIDLSTRWRGVGQLDAYGALLLRKSPTPVHIVREAGWSLASVSTLWKREDCLSLASADNRIKSPYMCSPAMDSMPTELSPPKIKIIFKQKQVKFEGRLLPIYLECLLVFQLMS